MDTEESSLANVCANEALSFTGTFSRSSIFLESLFNAMNLLLMHFYVILQIDWCLLLNITNFTTFLKLTFNQKIELYFTYNIVIPRLLK